MLSSPAMFPVSIVFLYLRHIVPLSLSWRISLTHFSVLLSVALNHFPSSQSPSLTAATIPFTLFITHYSNCQTLFSILSFEGVSFNLSGRAGHEDLLRHSGQQWTPILEDRHEEALRSTNPFMIISYAMRHTYGSRSHKHYSSLSTPIIIIAGQTLCNTIYPYYNNSSISSNFIQ
jgi:hypothetical protein